MKILLIFLCLFAACSQMETETFPIQFHEDRIEFSGVIYPERYNRYSDRQNGHHFIVWEQGRNARKALINTSVPDEQILDALIKIGARPGNNLTPETWTERTNQNSNEPDKRVEGSVIRISVQWNHTRLQTHELFKNARPEDVELHVGGHRELIPIWRSGCVTCMFSCPGGKTSNAAYTIRDQAYDRQSFVADTEKLPPDGTPVTVVVQLLSENEASEI